MTKREFKYHSRKKIVRHPLDWDSSIILKFDHICEDEGCSHYAMLRCVLDSPNEEGEWEEIIQWLCIKHAEEYGYCMGCGTFIAGTGMEFTNNGYCDNCFDEIQNSNYEDDEEDFANGSLDY